MMRFFLIVIVSNILFSCTDNPPLVLPSSPVNIFPNPFYDTVTVDVTASSAWEVSFLDKSGNNIKKYSGIGNAFFKVGFDNKQSETIIAQTKIGSTVYVNELLSAHK